MIKYKSNDYYLISKYYIQIIISKPQKQLCKKSTSEKTEECFQHNLVTFCLSAGCELVRKSIWQLQFCLPDKIMRMNE